MFRKKIKSNHCHSKQNEESNEDNQFVNLSNNVWQVIINEGKLDKRNIAMLSQTCKKLNQRFKRDNNRLFNLAVDPILDYKNPIKSWLIESPFSPTQNRIALHSGELLCSYNLTRHNQTISIYNPYTNPSHLLNQIRQPHINSTIKFIVPLRGSYFATVGFSDELIKIWHAKESDCIQEIDFSDFGEMSFSQVIRLPNNQLVIVMQTFSPVSNYKIYIYDLKVREIINGFGQQGEPFNAICATSDGAIVTATNNHLVIWDIFSGKKLHKWHTFDNSIIKQLFLSPDGDLISNAIAGNENAIELWDIKQRPQNLYQARSGDCSVELIGFNKDQLIYKSSYKNQFDCIYSLNLKTEKYSVLYKSNGSSPYVGNVALLKNGDLVIKQSDDNGTVILRFKYTKQKKYKYDNIQIAQDNEQHDKKCVIF